MPELPEVETNARNLARWIVGRSHLGMTGKILRADGALPRFTRATFELDDGSRVCFADSPRRARARPTTPHENAFDSRGAPLGSARRGGGEGSQPPCRSTSVFCPMCQPVDRTRPHD
ncbi:MAG TPA: hypothetical protein VKE22_16170 [Haliangiales bacterium]|nr:hypothetical protein [Haliangiales bacterium]